MDPYAQPMDQQTMQAIMQMMPSDPQSVTMPIVPPAWAPNTTNVPKTVSLPPEVVDALQRAQIESQILNQNMIQGGKNLLKQNFHPSNRKGT